MGGHASDLFSSQKLETAKNLRTEDTETRNKSTLQIVSSSDCLLHFSHPHFSFLWPVLVMIVRHHRPRPQVQSKTYASLLHRRRITRGSACRFHLRPARWSQSRPGVY